MAAPTAGVSTIYKIPRLNRQGTGSFFWKTPEPETTNPQRAAPRHGKKIATWLKEEGKLDSHETSVPRGSALRRDYMSKEVVWQREGNTPSLGAGHDRINTRPLRTGIFKTLSLSKVRSKQVRVVIDRHYPRKKNKISG